MGNEPLRGTLPAMIINTRKLREDHPSIRQRWGKKKITAQIRHSCRILAMSFIGIQLRQLLQEIRELHADVPPPTGKLEN